MRPKTEPRQLSLGEVMIMMLTVRDHQPWRYWLRSRPCLARCDRVVTLHAPWPTVSGRRFWRRSWDPAETGGTSVRGSFPTCHPRTKNTRTDTVGEPSTPSCINWSPKQPYLPVNFKLANGFKTRTGAIVEEASWFGNFRLYHATATAYSLWLSLHSALRTSLSLVSS